MNRLFDINLLTDAGWTEGEEWADCNPAQDFNGVFHRIYGESEEDDIPTYRISPGDNFYIGSDKNVIRDWHPIRDPWYLDISGSEAAPYSIYFGIQKGTADIDTNIENHAPYIVGNANSLFDISADYYRFFGLKMKDSDPAITLSSQVEGITVQDSVLINTPLIKTEGYRMIDWVLRNITFIGVVAKLLDVPLASSNVSLQDINATGEGDCGLSVENGHSEVEVIALTIDNEYHQYDEDGVIYHGLTFGFGSLATVRYNTINGFSGNAFKFYCEADVKGLVSDKCGAGIYFGEYATARDCMITFLRQIEGDSYAYYFEKDGELNNCGCNLDETGGLGVVVLAEGSTVTVNGGDYQINPPLPFATGIGASTIILNNVTINGVLYNETVDLGFGDSWRGEKAATTIETIPVYNNAIHFQPFEHIPALRNAVSIQGNTKPFDSVVTLPSGARVSSTTAGSVRFDPAEAYLHLDPGETEVDYFRYSTSDNIYVHQFIVQASPEVGAKVVQPDSFSSSGWSKDGAVYTGSNTNTSISSSYAFEVGEIYQISVKVEGRTSGGVIPSIGTAQGQYSHSINGTEVWLIRAPSNANAVLIEGQSFTGAVLNIYVRKLLRTETPAVPELEATVSGSDVELEWYLTPIERITDTVTPRVTKTGELAESARNGYYDRNGGTYLFEDAYSVGRKSTINLRGGDNLEIYKLKVTGGYRGEYEKWQNALSPEMNGGPYFNKIQALYIDCDLQLEASRGVYTSQFGNSDVIVFNGLTNAETFDARGWVLGMRGKGSSDGVIDSKKRTEVNHSTFIGGYRQFRLNRNGTGLVANCDFITEWGTKESFAPSQSYTLIHIWNSYVDGVRCVTIDQMKSLVRPDDHFSDVGAVRLNAGSIGVLKTYPTIDDHCRVAMTDMEFQVKSSGGASWYGLSFPDIGLPGVVGCFKRTVSLSSGSYQIRCRCFNGALTGAWSNIISITV